MVSIWKPSLVVVVGLVVVVVFVVVVFVVVVGFVVVGCEKPVCCLIQEMYSFTKIIFVKDIKAIAYVKLERVVGKIVFSN